MSKPFYTKKIYYFVLADRNQAAEGGSYSFNSYTDMAGALGAPGNRVIYDMGEKDRYGRPQGKYFTLNSSNYKLMCTEDQQDIRGVKLIDFFKNSPDCEGSPNGRYVFDEDGNKAQVAVKFKLMDTSKDAEVALDAGIQKTNAQHSALNIDDVTLQEIAAHFGIFGEPDKLMRVTVYEKAGKYPQQYFKILESGDRAVRAIVRKALKDGIFSTKGSMIMWESTVIGPDEDQAVATLLKDKSMLEALQEAVDLKTEVKVKGKPGPKPKKVEA